MDGFPEKQAKNSGFTLIEVLIVLTVVAVFGGIVFPIGKRVFQRACIEADKLKLRMLSLSYNTLRTEGRMEEGTRIGELILGLAGEGIDDTSWYHSSAKSGRNAQKIIGNNGETLVKRIASDWVMVYNLPPDVNPETTPVFYSCGLKEDGTWSPKSAYGEKGGLIAFLSGDVRFVTNAKEALVSCKTGQSTGNIYEALPQGSVITNVFTVP